MRPVCEFDRVVEPVDRQARQSFLELREGAWVFGQDVETDERTARRIASEPSRPDRKHSCGIGEAADEVAQGRPDRGRSAVWWRDIAVDDDDGTRRQPGRQVGHQRTGRTVTDDDYLTGLIDVIEKMAGPVLPGGRLAMMRQEVRDLDRAALGAQACCGWVPARGPHGRPGDQDEVRGVSHL